MKEQKSNPKKASVIFTYKMVFDEEPLPDEGEMIKIALEICSQDRHWPDDNDIKIVYE